MNMSTHKTEMFRNLGLIGVLLLLLLLGRFELTWQFFMQAALVLAFLVISYVDWQTQKIPNVLLLPLGALTLLLVLLQPGTAWMRLAGALFAFVPFALTSIVHPHQLGGGDIKLVTLLGLLFGFPNIVWVLLIAVLGGGAVAVTMLLTKRGTAKTELPYAPFLCFGSLIVLLVLPFYPI
ncbi:MAG: prepilin peptidase [Chloroflexi bacterium]|nr:prepilin peptidase [Chloroflexota bacterium]